MDREGKGISKPLRTYAIGIRSERSVLQPASWRQQVWSLHIERKKGFITLSFLFCFLHLAILSTDILSHLLTESVQNSSYPFAIALLISHVVSFYWALMGAIYSLQCGARRLCALALFSVALNVLVFVARAWFELHVMKFREEIY